MATEGIFDKRSVGADVVPAASGKPYTWDLPRAEDVEYRALPPQVLIERVFARTETFQQVLKRTAAFLVVTSRNNGYEGRDPLVVFDDVRGGTVAEFLNIDLDLLGRALVEMQRHGLISAMEDGNLHIDNLAALDQFSEQQPALLTAGA